MPSDLGDLKITEKELEYLSGIDASDISVDNIYRVSSLRNPAKSVSFCLNQFFIFGLTLVFILPIGLIILRNFGGLDKGVYVVYQLLQVTLGISLVTILIWNLYLWLKSRSLLSLVKLIDEVDKYNEVIKAVEIIDQLEAVRNLKVSLINREEVIEALGVMRESLVCALMTEKILRENKQFIARRYELFDRIENNLTTLMTLRVNDQANEYGQLLNEVLQIGMSVRQEVEKLQDGPH